MRWFFHFLLALLLVVVALLLCSGFASAQTYEVRTKQGRQTKIITVSETDLDANRSVVVGDERIFIPKPLPKQSKLERWNLIRTHYRQQGKPVPERIRKKFERYFERETAMTTVEKVQKSRRSLPQRSFGDEAVWRKTGPARPFRQDRYRPHFKKGPLYARNTLACPEKFDAVTRSFDKKLFLFAGNYVYLNWYDLDGLHQRVTYLISEVFPGAPPQVTAAMTNLKTGTTILFYYQTVYRFRWHKGEKKFFIAQNSPQQLPEKVAFTPKWAFQWRRRMIISNGEDFVTYDPYLNHAEFAAKLNTYLPNIPRETIGLSHDGNQTLLLFTSDNKLKVYDDEKHKVVQEYPVSVKDFVACLPPKKPDEKEQSISTRKPTTKSFAGKKSPKSGG